MFEGYNSFFWGGGFESSQLCMETSSLEKEPVPEEEASLYWKKVPHSGEQNGGNSLRNPKNPADSRLEKSIYFQYLFPGAVCGADVPALLSISTKESTSEVLHKDYAEFDRNLVFNFGCGLLAVQNSLLLH